MAVRKNGKENAQQNLNMDDNLQSLVNMSETSETPKVRGCYTPVLQRSTSISVSTTQSLVSRASSSLGGSRIRGDKCGWRLE